MEKPDAISIEEFTKLHPADLADRLQRLPVEESRDILMGLPASLAAAVVSELDHEQSQELLAGFSPEQVTAFLAAMPANEAADIAGELSDVQRAEALAELPPEKSAKVSALLLHREDTAGGIMSDRFIALRADQTVQQSQDMLRNREQQAEDVSYLYVTDSQQKLQGVVSLRDLVFRSPDRRIGEIMNPEVRFVRVNDDQEEIARRFEHYHYLGLPVLDDQDRLVGVVRANDVIEVAQHEATEDMQLMVGLSGEERTLTPWHKSVRTRLPWLYVNLITAFGGAAVVALFEQTIAGWTALAIFLPIVSALGGNSGAQTLTIIIRDLALGELSPGDGRRALFKEVFVGLANGLAVGVMVGVVSYLWKGEVSLGVVIAIAMVLNMMAAALSGVLIPFGLKAAKIDPALASSIFVTAITDIAGFFFFLSLATVALHWWGK